MRLLALLLGVLELCLATSSSSLSASTLSSLQGELTISIGDAVMSEERTGPSLTSQLSYSLLLPEDYRDGGGSSSSSPPRSGLRIPLDNFDSESLRFHNGTYADLRTGSTVRVWGSHSESEEFTFASAGLGLKREGLFEVSAVQILDVPAQDSIHRRAGTQAFTSHTTLTILLNFEIDGVTYNCEHSYSEAEQRLFTQSRSIDTIYRRVSHGQHGFSGDIIGPYTISISSACAEESWASAAEALAVADGYDPEDYLHRFFLIPKRATDCSWDGWSYIGCTFVTACRTWLGYDSVLLMAHEFGHSFGFNHAYRGVSGTSSEDQSTFMEKIVNSNWKMMNGPHAHWTGWAESLTSPGSGTYTLAPLDLDTGFLPQVIKVENNQYISFRRYGGWDDGLDSTYRNLINIHTWTGLSRDDTRWITAIGVGESYITGELTISVNSITVNNADADNAVIVLTYEGDEPACSPEAPSFSFNPVDLCMAPSTSTTDASFTISNNDEGGCVAETFDIQVGADDDVTATVSPVTATISPGGSYTDSFTINAGASTGTFHLPMQIKRDTDPSFTSYTLFVFVESPAIASITDLTASFNDVDESVTVSWTEPTITRTYPCSPYLERYNVYRDGVSIASDVLSISSTGGGSLEFTDTGASLNTVHSYHVIVVTTNGISGSNSNSVDVDTTVAGSCVTADPSVSKNFNSLCMGVDDIFTGIMFTVSSNDDVSCAADTFTLAASSNNEASFTASIDPESVSLAPGETYVADVELTSHAVEGKYTLTLGATRGSTKSQGITVYVAAVTTGAPALTVLFDEETESVTLFWVEPSIARPWWCSPYLDFYQIYRDGVLLSSSVNSINDESGGGTLEYTDASANIDSTYTYHVIPVATNGQLGTSSNVEVVDTSISVPPGTSGSSSGAVSSSSIPYASSSSSAPQSSTPQSSTSPPSSVSSPTIPSSSTLPSSSTIPSSSSTPLSSSGPSPSSSTGPSDGTGTSVPPRSSSSVSISSSSTVSSSASISSFSSSSSSYSSTGEAIPLPPDSNIFEDVRSLAAIHEGPELIQVDSFGPFTEKGQSVLRFSLSTANGLPHVHIQAWADGTQVASHEADTSMGLDIEELVEFTEAAGGSDFPIAELESNSLDVVLNALPLPSLSWTLSMTGDSVEGYSLTAISSDGKVRLECLISSSVQPHPDSKLAAKGIILTPNSIHCRIGIEAFSYQSISSMLAMEGVLRLGQPPANQQDDWRNSWALESPSTEENLGLTHDKEAELRVTTAAYVSWPLGEAVAAHVGEEVFSTADEIFDDKRIPLWFANSTNQPSSVEWSWKLGVSLSNADAPVQTLPPAATPLATGAVVGIAIGSLLVAIISAVIVWRVWKSQSAQNANGNAGPVVGGGKHAPVGHGQAKGVESSRSGMVPSVHHDTNWLVKSGVQENAIEVDIPVTAPVTNYSIGQASAPPPPAMPAPPPLPPAFPPPSQPLPALPVASQALPVIGLSGRPLPPPRRLARGPRPGPLDV